jgi:hypothetical protein
LMPPVRRKQKPIRAEGSASRVKGRLVEALVSAMHALPGATVRQNVRLPAIGGVRKREIDVLIDGTVASYPIRIAIECKNERTVTGSPQIDAFIGKLQDIGIPTQHGIFVSVKGFTKGALARARQVGVRTLILTGLTEDRLAETVYGAFGSVVFLWPVAIAGGVDTAADTPSTHELMVFRGSDGEVIGSVVDLFWAGWVRGEVPNSLGLHEVAFSLPDGWFHKIGDELRRPEGLWGQIHVYGVTIGVAVTASVHDLFDARTNSRLKTMVRLHDSSSDDTFNVAIFADENGLTEHIRQSEAQVKLITRIRLPRLDWKGSFWPPSIESRRKHAAAAEIARARGEDPFKIDTTQFEREYPVSVWDSFEIEEHHAELLKQECVAQSTPANSR